MADAGPVIFGPIRNLAREWVHIWNGSTECLSLRDEGNLSDSKAGEVTWEGLVPTTQRKGFF